MNLFSDLLSWTSAAGWLAVLNGILVALLVVSVVRHRRLRYAFRRQRKYNDDLIENLSEGIYRSTPDGQQLSANKALVRLNGYDSEAEMLRSVGDIGKEWYVLPERREEFRTALLRDGKVEDFVSEIHRHKTRERIWITESARLVRHPLTGRALFYEGSVRDITETVRRQNLEQHIKKLTSELPGALFQFVMEPGCKTSVTFLSQGIARISGFAAEEILAQQHLFHEAILEEDRPAFGQSLMVSNATLEPWDHEFRIRTKHGEDKWLRVTARPETLPAEQGGGVIWHGYLADISARKMQEMEIRELAFFDPLTRLPNRRMFLSRMPEILADCQMHRHHGALLFIDIDDFKTLNDTQGHDVGDEFLAQVAGRLGQCAGPRDLVARIGGDEFVVVLSDCGPDAAHATVRAITVANQMLSSLARDFRLGELRHMGSASIVVVQFDGSERRADEILKRADMAMYEVKASGRNGMALFDPSSMDRESKRYRLLGDLRIAFDVDQLDLHYQPLVDHTGSICGAEALVRWNHPTCGLIMPDDFIHTAEQFGLGPELARMVLDRALHTLRGWQDDERTADLRLSINVSVQSFSSDDFIPTVERLLGEHGVDGAKLTFELTEHVMAKDHARVAARMNEIKRLGVRLSLDDFGTGYSSLAYLKQLPFDEVKIDGSFVADIETAESDRALVKTILAMARTLGLRAVAEHVENVRQEAFLRAFGCDYFQGHLYSRAVPAGRFFELVEAHAGPRAAHTPPTLRHQA